ncbi:MAG TPA: 1-deoxy-D-xylulose-5-phosphate synthase N-terminal domain-containing protein, partial [Acidimicrobiales bacterium]
MLLESIDNPADLRSLTYDQLGVLAEEIRDHIVTAVSA